MINENDYCCGYFIPRDKINWYQKIVLCILPSQSVLLNVAFNIIVSHVQLELKALLDVNDARVRAALGVDFSIEQLRCLNACNHVTSAAVNRDVVT